MLTVLYISHGTHKYKISATFRYASSYLVSNRVFTDLRLIELYFMVKMEKIVAKPLFPELNRLI